MSSGLCSVNEEAESCSQLTNNSSDTGTNEPKSSNCNLLDVLGRTAAFWGRAAGEDEEDDEDYEFVSEIQDFPAVQSGESQRLFFI